LETRRKYIRGLLNFLDQLPERITIFRRKYQQKILLFLFFVLLSTIFWVIRSLSEVYETEILYPVKYANIPENKVLINEPPDRLKLQVRAIGRTILAHKYSFFLRPLKFNVSSYTMNSIGTDSCYVLTRIAREPLSQELGNLTILDISPDTLFFRFTEVVTKKAGIKHNVANYPDIFARQYMINGKMAFVPDSIIVSGPQNIIDTLKNVYTEPISLNNVTDSVEIICVLKKIDQVAFSRKKVRLLIPVDKYTEHSYLANIRQVNVPDSIVLKTFPSSVRITYNITLSYYNKIDPGMLEPYVDYNSIESSMSSKLKVMLDNVPDYVHSLTLYPSSVEFLIEK
jgi:hypothetical protein